MESKSEKIKFQIFWINLLIWEMKEYLSLFSDFHFSRFVMLFQSVFNVNGVCSFCPWSMCQLCLSFWQRQNIQDRFFQLCLPFYPCPNIPSIVLSQKWKSPISTFPLQLLHSALHAACEEGHLLCVLTLLKAGGSLTLPTNWGTLPIHLAAQNNRRDIVRTFLEFGCSADMVSW